MSREPGLKSDDQSHRESLDGLQFGRGVAALLVVGLHANDFYLPKRIYDGQQGLTAFNMGYAGVDFFFVLSGFIIYYVHHQHISKPAAFGEFVWKRFTRLYPFYWVLLAFLLLLYTAFPDRGPDAVRDPVAILYNLALWPTEEFPVIDPAWSLHHELLFYVVFGLCILNGRIGALILAAWMAGCVIDLFDPVQSFPATFLFYERNLQFAMGLCVAWVALNRGISNHRLWLAIGAIGFFGTGLTEVYELLPWSEDMRGISLGVASAVLVAGLIDTSLRIPKLGKLLGDASYSIYLTHTTTLAVGIIIAKALPLPDISSYVLAIPPTLMTLILVANATAIGVAVHLCVEKPLIAWVRRRGAKSTKTKI